MKVSVCFSFFNEDALLDELIRRLRLVFSGALKGEYEYEFVFINDRSTDGSLEILNGYAQSDLRIKVATTSRNFGVSQCMLAAMEISTGDLVVIMDTDLQDPPEVIPDLIRTWKETAADVVYTVRDSRAGEPRLKMWATKIGYVILKRFSSVDQPVNSGDFKLMTRRVVKEVLKLDEMEPFLRGLIRWVGFKQVPFRYDREERFAGETHYVFYRSRVLKNFLSGVTSFSDAPLYLTFSLGICVSALSFLYLAVVVVMKGMGINLPGWSAIMATVLFLGGIQILAIGVLGLYIAKIHIEVKNRPNCILDQKINC